MITKLIFIGLIDNSDNVHGVELQSGLNIITGKSSTGKSSIIEIFDYCMGSSEDTIPLGVIKSNASIFFLLMHFNGIDYIIGRSINQVDYYILENPTYETPYNISASIFDGRLLKKDDFLASLGAMFGIDAIHTVETLEQHKDRRKAGKPSIRNMMPFILQHQNLIANKQAIFYRFDQKEKREQTINQFKVFAGIVDAQYYSLAVELAKLKEKLEKQRRVLQLSESNIELLYNKLLEDIKVYTQITGNQILQNISLELLEADPNSFKEEVDKIDYFGIQVSIENQAELDEFNELEAEENRLMLELRDAQSHLEEVKNSIDYIAAYKSSLEEIKCPEKVEYNYSICPFCHQHTSYVEQEMHTLSNAIRNLNSELKQLPQLTRPLHEECLNIQDYIEAIKCKLNDVYQRKERLADIKEELKRNVSLQKQAYKILYLISSRIDLISKEPVKSIKDKIEELEDLIQVKNKEVKKYNVDGYMTLANRLINQSMAEYRKSIPFESSLDTFKLKFDLTSFELYFEKDSEKKYLRSIGSGANWLNAHLCLFLALADYFYNQKKSTVPSLLFLDQPSQVYFPAHKDTGKSFNPTKESINSSDADILAVNKVFSLLYDFCIKHSNQIQLIVTDHADDLTISESVDFESLVVARWRGEHDGLIDVTKEGVLVS